MGKSFQAMKLERFPTEVGITAETIPAIEKSTQLLFENGGSVKVIACI